MKKIIFLLIFLLVLSCFVSCGSQEPSETPEETEAESTVAEAVFIPDFTVKCIDGSDFTLSEALKDHEMVLINLFFSNCPPCAMEFPVMQEAISEMSDSMTVIALSVDPDDTDEVLEEYAKELGISIPMSHEEGTDLRDFVVSYPTSLLVDQDRRVISREWGAKITKEEFLDWFDGYTGGNYDSEVCTYRVGAYNVEDWTDVPGLVINFCTDTTCSPVTTDEKGYAYFTGRPDKYHVEIAKVPDGWQLDADSESEWYTEPFAESFYVGLTKVE